MLMSFTLAGSRLFGLDFFILMPASLNFLLIILIISHDLVLIIMLIVLSDVGSPPARASLPLLPSRPFPVGQPGSLGLHVFPGAARPRCAQSPWVPAGRGSEGGRQVSLTTLPLSSLGRSWPSSVTTLQMGRSLLASFGFKTFPGRGRWRPH